ncbi:MAG: putative metal-binding motif-containing protein, partial [bacterium]
MKKKLCIIALSFLVICSLFAMNAMVGEAWTLDIATIGQKADVNTSIIGTDPNGPIVYPYPPNNPPDFSAIIKIKGTGDDRNKEDYRAPGSAQEVWELEVTVAGPNPLGGSADIDANDFWPVLSWDPNGILGASQGMDLYLGDANGTFLLDMRTANSYQTVETDAEEVVESWDYALFSFTVVFDSVPWCLDADGDGYGDAANSVYEPLSGYVLDCSDCDDSDPNTYPGAAEICDGQDNNCDSSVPVNEVDDDGDSYSECEGDCNDADNTVYPGAPELCDEKDNDCNGTIDDPNALSYSTYYQDADTDGYGNAGVSQIACAQPAGYVLDATDCNDGDADTHPGATELCDGEDNNCDGTVPADEVDADLDGYLACNECDDTDAARFPGNPEVCDGKDNNCDGTTPVDEVDADLDGYLACNECDDTDAVRFPGNPEVCDGKDNDCDGTVPADEVDADSDGYLACNECDDTDAAINPGAAELCDGIDNDCSGVIDDPNALVYNDYYRDADEDGYGDLNDTQNDCVQPAGYVLDSTDCNDADPNINPAATEVCDGIDNDCNGTVDDPSVLTYEDYYLDADEDGYGDLNNSQNACSQPDGYVLDSTDCDDTDAAINPGAEEVYDGIDNNCDGKTDENCYFVENLIATGQEVTGQPQTVSVDFGLDWDLAGILADP